MDYCGYSSSVKKPVHTLFENDETDTMKDLCIFMQIDTENKKCWLEFGSEDYTTPITDKFDMIYDDYSTPSVDEVLCDMFKNKIKQILTMLKIDIATIETSLRNDSDRYKIYAAPIVDKDLMDMCDVFGLGDVQDLNFRISIIPNKREELVNLVKNDVYFYNKFKDIFKTDIVEIDPNIKSHGTPTKKEIIDKFNKFMRPVKATFDIPTVIGDVMTQKYFYKTAFKDMQSTVYTLIAIKDMINNSEKYLKDMDLSLFNGQLNDLLFKITNDKNYKVVKFKVTDDDILNNTLVLPGWLMNILEQERITITIPEDFYFTDNEEDISESKTDQVISEHEEEDDIKLDDCIGKDYDNEDLKNDIVSLLDLDENSIKTLNKLLRVIKHVSNKMHK